MSFNEPEWFKLLFLLADTQTWLDELTRQAFIQLPLQNKKKFFSRTYCLTATALAHIVERHYYKINRYPHTGKFHIPLTEILHHIREAKDLPASPVPGSCNFQRIIQTESPIGFNKHGQPTNSISILTDTGGNIITAFPGTCITP